MSEAAVRVVKVGGSLFDMPDLGNRLKSWLNGQSPAAHVLVAGGGPLADEIRSAAKLHRLTDAQAHWICIDVLTATARLLAALLGNAEPVLTYRELQQSLAQGLERARVFASADFLRVAEAALPGPRLPHDWSVTSDSIAARLALALDAHELVLLKSRDVPPELSIEEAAASGFVDEFLPQAARRLSVVRWVNLRSPTPDDRVLLGH